ncbi:MAG: Brp/Blh family beta-carotene 15,15'-dioxygenase, partial [Bacteroidota bacterium]
MNPIRFPIDRWLIVSALLFSLLFFWIDGLAEAVALPVFVLVMLSIGIPHGANDHIAHQLKGGQNSPYTSLGHFIGMYVAKVLVYGGLWLLSPLLGLIIFLGISAWHFGEIQFSDLGLKNQPWLRMGLYLSWGAWCLVGIIGFHPAESQSILAGLQIEINLLQWFSLPIFVMLSFGVFLCLGMVYHRTKMNRQRLRWEGMNLLALLLLFQLPELLLVFAIYFGLWHSFPSIRAQLIRFHQLGGNMPLQTYIIRSLPFSLLSFIGIGLLFLLQSIFFPSLSLIMLFFIVVSTITLPHVWE